MVRVRSGAGAAFEVGSRVLVVRRTLMAGIRHDFAAAAICSATSSLSLLWNTCCLLDTVVGVHQQQLVHRQKQTLSGLYSRAASIQLKNWPTVLVVPGKLRFFLRTYVYSRLDACSIQFSGSRKEYLHVQYSR